MSKRKILEDISKCMSVIEAMSGKARRGQTQYWDGVAQGCCDSAKQIRRVYEKWDNKYCYRILPSG